MKITMHRLFLTAALSGAALLTGCQQPPAGSDAGGAAAGGSSSLLLDGRDHDHYGLGAHEGDTITVAELLAAPEKYDGQFVRVAGPVEAVCKQAGCWARMGSGDPDLFIKMKDHAFFLPLDCEGRQAVMEGVVRIEETSVEELQHYAEDAGKSAEEVAKITAPKREVVLTAAGVALTKGGQ